MTSPERRTETPEPSGLSERRNTDPPPRAGRGAPLAMDRWLDHLERLLAFRVAGIADAAPSARPVPPVQAIGEDTAFARLVAEHRLDGDETLLLAIGLAPLVRPDLFDRVVAGSEAAGTGLELLGGTRGKQHRGMLPTGDTVLCLLAGANSAARLRWQAYLMGEGRLVREGLVLLDPPETAEPPMSGRFLLDPDTAELILTGRHHVPRLSARLPARRIETGLSWSDLVLPAQTLAQVQEILAWIEHGATLLDGWVMRPKLRPGCRALFFGPPPAPARP